VGIRIGVIVKGKVGAAQARAKSRQGAQLQASGLVGLGLQPGLPEPVDGAADARQLPLLQHLLRLDKLGIIELREHNRYRLRVSKMLRWQAHGPVMRYFRERVMRDYYAGDFHAEGETLLLVHGEIALSAAMAFNDKLERLVEDFARQHRADQKLPEERKLPFTLVLGMRRWWFEAFHDLRREAARRPAAPGALPGRPVRSNPQRTSKRATSGA
jgi:hypothetical protein